MNWGFNPQPPIQKNLTEVLDSTEQTLIKSDYLREAQLWNSCHSLPVIYEIRSRSSTLLGLERTAVLFWRIFITWNGIWAFNFTCRLSRLDLVSARRRKTVDPVIGDRWLDEIFARGQNSRLVNYWVTVDRIGGGPRGIFGANQLISSVDWRS